MSASVRRLNPKGTNLFRGPAAPRAPWRARVLFVVLALIAAALIAFPAFAQSIPVPAPSPPASPGVGDAVDHALGELGGGKAPLSLSLQILIIMGLLSILPGILLMMTSFTRIIIVLSLLRQALGLQQTPPNQVLIGLSLFLSLFVMAPTIERINKTAIEPYAAGQIGATEMIKNGAVPLHAFMMHQTRKQDIALFAGIAKSGPYARVEDVPYSVLLPSFVTSELKTAFQIGFLIFLPFIIIDLIVASVLVSLGMTLVSPTIISLPFKLLLFVLIDGWALTMGSLTNSFLR